MEAAERELECPVEATEKKEKGGMRFRRPRSQHSGSQGTSLLRSESGNRNFGDGVISGRKTALGWVRDWRGNASGD